MVEERLQACQILIVEDEYVLADELDTELCDAGAVVIGPVGTMREAMILIDTEVRIDGAILDVNLGGDKVFPLADLLIARQVPIVFTTGYDVSIMPIRFKSIARCEKPVNLTDLTRAIGKAIRAPSSISCSPLN